MAEDSSLKIELKSIAGLSYEDKQKVASFSCGESQIDDYLHEDALVDSLCNITRTFLLFIGDEIIGYFTLVADKALLIKNSRVNRKLPDHPFFKLRRGEIPALQIHHFAVRKEWQNSGVGRLLMNYLINFIKVRVYPYVGVSLLTVYSLEKAQGFYKKIGFEKTGNNSCNVNMALVLSEVID